jgi:phospholipid/cholesterol/gamma-HCH transport system substrate-binding protein
MRRESGMPPVRAGLIALALIIVGTYLAFARGLPVGDHYEIEAVVRTANNVKERQPVRIAGVDVGKVVDVRHLEPGTAAAVVTMRIEDTGRPIHRDARVSIRPRMFLEGNWFIDLQPGTPAAGELPDGGSLPIAQTRGPVQLGQLFNALQSDTRKNLQTLLKEYSSALEGEGADGYRRSIPYWEPAYRNSAIVQEASLGVLQHDLSDYIDASGRVARGLDRSPAALKALIADFNTAAGAFAREAQNLSLTIDELPRTLGAARPALFALNEALPPFRRFAEDLEPSIEESGRTIDVALPFLQQARLLVSREELRGLANDLRPTAPALARLTELTRPLYEEVRAAASCENEVLHEWSTDRIEDPRFPASGPVYQEAPKPLPGLAAESRNGDANGQWVHVLTSAGDRTINIGNGLFAQAYRPLIGTNPPKPDARPPLRADVACETQEPPDLRTIPGPPDTEVARGLPDTAEARERWSAAPDRAIDWLEDHLRERGLDDDYRVALP